MNILVSDGVTPTNTPVTSGTRVPLMRPCQGGRVIYVGVEARNIDGCVELSGTLREPSGAFIKLDARTSQLVLATDGWGRTDPLDTSRLANVAPCFNYRAR